MGRFGRLGRLAPIVATVAVVGACGGSSPQSPGDQARAVVEHFYADIADGKGAQACSLLTPAAREEIVRPFVLFAKLHRLDCERLLGADGKVALSGASVRLPATKVSLATVSGDRATVVVTVGDQGLVYVPLTKTSAGWRISHIAITSRKAIEG